MLVLLLWLAGIGAACAALYVFATAAGTPAPRWLTEWQYAHRGLHGDRCPENTLPAFEAAAKAGYGIELDVHLTADSEIIVFHDNDLKRLTGVTGTPESRTYDEIRSLSVCGTEQRIPLLTEVLELVAGRVPVLIETKNRGRAGELEMRLGQLLKEYGGRTAVQSFSPFSMQWFSRRMPSEPCGQLSSSFASETGAAPWYQLFAVKHLLTNFLCRPNFVSYGAEGLLQPVVRRLRRHNTPVLAWTVTSAEQAAQIAPFCDTIIFEGFLPEVSHDRKA